MLSAALSPFSFSRRVVWIGSEARYAVDFQAISMHALSSPSAEVESGSGGGAASVYAQLSNMEEGEEEEQSEMRLQPMDNTQGMVRLLSSRLLSSPVLALLNAVDVEEFSLSRTLSPLLLTSQLFALCIATKLYDAFCEAALLNPDPEDADSDSELMMCGQ
jgi:Regulator of volume decrease after cellular swelling